MVKIILKVSFLAPKYTFKTFTISTSFDDKLFKFPAKLFSEFETVQLLLLLAQKSGLVVFVFVGDQGFFVVVVFVRVALVVIVVVGVVVVSVGGDSRREGADGPGHVGEGATLRR